MQAWRSRAVQSKRWLLRLSEDLEMFPTCHVGSFIEIRISSPQECIGPESFSRYETLSLTPRSRHYAHLTGLQERLIIGHGPAEVPW